MATDHTKEQDIEACELQPTSFVMSEVAQPGEGGAGGEGESMMKSMMTTLMPQCSELTMKRLFLYSMFGQAFASIVGVVCLLLNGWPVLLIPVLGYTIQVFTRSLALYNLLFQAFFAFLGVWAFLGNKDKETKAKVIDDKGMNLYFMICAGDFVVCLIAIILLGPFILFPLISLTIILGSAMLMYTLFFALGWAFSWLCWPCGFFVAFVYYCVAAFFGCVFFCAAVFFFWAQWIIPFTWLGFAVVFIVFDILHFLLFFIVHLVGFITVGMGGWAMMKYHKAQNGGDSKVAAAAEE